MCSENDLPLAQMSPLMRRMRVTDKGQGPPQVKHFLTKGNHALYGSMRAHPAKVQVSKSPFTNRIEGAKLPRRFNQPVFAIYNGRADPVEHVSQFNQKMAIYSQNEALMCKIFPSSLGSMAIRWFNSLKTNSIGSYKQLTQAFCSRFITNIRVPRPLSLLLSLLG